MYQLKSKVRYSETNSCGCLTYYALFNYLQDTVTFHSETLGESTEYLRERNMAWVLSFWQVCIEEMPRFHEDIEVSTWSYDTKGFLGLRNLCMKNAKREDIIKVNSIWVLVDTKTGHPTRITDEIAAHYPNEPKLEMDDCGRKIDVPPVYEEGEPIVVPQSFMDTNHHMNNAKYVLIAEGYLPKGYDVKEIRAEYKKAAMLGTVLFPHITLTEKDVTIVLTGEKGDVYAVVQFIKRCN